jgi:hypothetical protein
MIKRIAGGVGGIILMVMFQGIANGQSFMSSQLEEARRQAKAIAVVPAAYVPKVIYDIRSREAPLTTGQIAGGAAAILLYPLAALKMLDWQMYNSLPGEQTEKMMGPLKMAMADNGIVLDDASALLAEQVVAASAGMTESAVKMVREAGPRTVKRDLDHEAPSLAASDMAIVVRVNEIGFIGITQGVEQKEGEKAQEERTSDGVVFVRVESDPPITIGLRGEITVVRIRDGKELLKEPLLHFSPPRRISEWAGDPMAVKRQIDKVFQRYSRNTAEYIYLAHDLKPISSGESMVYCVMGLREPSMAPPSSDRKTYTRSEFGAAGSLQPVLKWEAFPRYKDREEGPKDFVNRISGVTYDLRVWKGREGSPTDLVYERTALKAVETWTERSVKPVRFTESGPEELQEILRREGTAEHTIDLPLEPSSEYFWTVRARFKFDGKTRTTPWSHFTWPQALVCSGKEMPGPGLSYRFRTRADPAMK